MLAATVVAAKLEAARVKVLERLLAGMQSFRSMIACATQPDGSLIVCSGCRSMAKGRSMHISREESFAIGRDKRS